MSNKKNASIGPATIMGIASPLVPITDQVVEWVTKKDVTGTPNWLLWLIAGVSWLTTQLFRYLQARYVTQPPADPAPTTTYMSGYMSGAPTFTTTSSIPHKDLGDANPVDPHGVPVDHPVPGLPDDSIEVGR